MLASIVAVVRIPVRQRWLLSWLGLFLLAFLGARPVRAQNPAPQPADNAGESEEAVQGLFITVPNPIDSKAVNRVKSTTDRFLQRNDHRGLHIVYDFNPDGHASGQSDYGPCEDLAEYLIDLPGDVTTVGFVRNDVTGYAVLPVLACRDVVLASQAKLGDVLRAENKPMRENRRLFFLDVIKGRRCPAIVRKMFDKDIEVVEGTLGTSQWWAVKGEEEKGFVVKRDNPVVMPAGMVGLYTAQQALEYKLADRIEETRFDVMKAYRLPPRSLRGDPLEGRTPHAWRIEVTGQVNGALKEALERRIRRAVSRQANLIILQLECGKGDTQDALDLAEFLRGLMDDAGENHVMTVAYLTEQARDTATYLALGCTEIVMDKQAKLGGFEQLAQENPTHQPMRAQSLKGLAEEQGISALLVQGMLDRDLVIHRVRSKRGRLVRTLLDGKALEEDKALPADQQKWIDEGQIKGQGELLELSATQAEELGVAQLVVDGPSTNSLPVIYAHYGLAPDQVQSAGPDWLDELAAFLSRPVVSVFLVMIGIAGLILELKMPGVGFPGVVSAICFVLYFWAHSRLAGQLTWLAVLLFVLGLILIGLEVFVVPGFGVTGISGIVLVVLSLALATVVKKPETTQEWLRFGGTISTLALSLVAAVVGAFVIAWYLPHIPYANRLVLAPPEIPHEEEEETTRPRDRMMEMLGAIGVAATPLRPAGKARFGEEFVDVVAEGSYVPEGTRVQVVEIEGNRIVVKEV